MLGVDDYIRKPFAMDRLIDSVERLLSVQRD
jgi:DNA-binding response OmpR family regulator